MNATIRESNGKELYELISSNPVGSITEDGMEIMRNALAISSSVWVGSMDGKVLGFWGLVPPSLLSDRAYLWLYTTPNLHEHVFTFVRHSQRIVEAMLREYPLIVGECLVGSDKSIRWLEWLGAEFGSPNGKLIPFQIKAK
jgi:hypothetical protein